MPANKADIGYDSNIPTQIISTEYYTMHIFCPTLMPSWGVLVLLKIYRTADIVEFVLGRFSHFYIGITYSKFTFCGA